MKKALRNGAVCVAVSMLAWGCIGVHGTIRVEHVYEGGAPEAGVPAVAVVTPQVVAETPPPAAPEKPAVAVAPAEPVAPAPAVRKSDRIELEVARDARVMHHSSVRNSTSGGSAARLRARNIDRGSAEIFLLDFDRAALRAFVKKYEGQSFSGKLVLDVREVQNGPGEVEACIVESTENWSERNLSAVAPQPGKKWTSPDGTEHELLKDLLYADGVIKAVLNSHTVTVNDGDAGSKAEMTLDEKFIRHYATAPHVRGMGLFTRNERCVADFYGRAQRQKGAVLIVETK